MLTSLDKYLGTNCIRTYPMDEYVPSTLRVTDKENNAAERLVYSNYWREQIDMYGQKIQYYRNPYNIQMGDNLYGELPLSAYEGPYTMIMGVKLSENALILSKFGYQSDDTVTAFLHISSFYHYFPPNSEPKAGDLFKLVEYGSDRPGERDGKVFEITERVDEDNSQINPLMGHYVWMLKAKRFEYSEEPNAPKEKGNNQVFDDTFYGTLTATSTPTQRVSSYPGDVDNDSKKFVFDMSINDTLEYGGYY